MLSIWILQDRPLPAINGVIWPLYMALQMGFTGVVIAEKWSDNLAISDNPTYKLVGAHDVFNCQQESPSSSSERRWVPLPRADSERLEAILAHAAGKEPII